MDHKIFSPKSATMSSGKPCTRAGRWMPYNLGAWEKHAPASDPRFIAYSLATTFHETARSMAPLRNLEPGAVKAYGNPVPPYNQVYFGRGYVQLTWERNYVLATKRLRERGVVSQ